MSVEPVRIAVALPAGDTEVSGLWSAAPAAAATVAFAHGAGAGMEHPFLTGLADALAASGISVLRFVFPYVEAGRRMPGPAPHAMATWAGVEAWLASAAPGRYAAVGKSYGGRMASMASAEGENDPFIAPRAQFDEVVASCQDARVHWIAGGNHSFEVKGARRPADEIGAALAPVIAEFARSL
ncbi:alpha/beta family hydrolase [uncultured Microbacterium sp.]|uniref:alpha/beta hydrolase family protein n=1 Tax=uncultured Microbacterium sp. TaxID=191216 RepID=UPI0025ED5CAC|nr:alpha/beta family hydrolase [uncultured Microbacterium sp.]